MNCLPSALGAIQDPPGCLAWALLGAVVASPIVLAFIHSDEDHP